MVRNTAIITTKATTATAVMNKCLDLEPVTIEGNKLDVLLNIYYLRLKKAEDEEKR